MGGCVGGGGGFICVITVGVGGCSSLSLFVHVA